MVGRWAALIAVLATAVVGCSASDQTAAQDSSSSSTSSSETTPSTAAAPGTSTSPTTSGTSAPAAPFGAMTIRRTGDGFSVTGEVADAAEQQSLPALLRQVMPGARIVDRLVVKPGVAGPDIAGLGGLFGAALDIPDFSAALVGDTVTLRGRAPSERIRKSAEESVTATWPGVKIVDDIAVGR